MLTRPVDRNVRLVWSHPDIGTCMSLIWKNGL